MRGYETPKFIQSMKQLEKALERYTLACPIAGKKIARLNHNICRLVNKERRRNNEGTERGGGKRKIAS